MQFHHHGYVSEDPRTIAAAGTGVDRPADLPDEMDVLIVGSGPAGMLLAAQMSQFPGITTRIIEKRDGRLVLGQADGIQPRSVETFQAFGFAERITAEAYNIAYMNFWNPDPENPDNIVRTTRTEDYGLKISEFPHLIVNQARVLDYFAEAAEHGPGRIVPDYGVEFLGLTVHDDGEFPVEVRVQDAAGERTVRAKYVVGCDGARSGVREAIGRTHVGEFAAHAWGVMDVLVNTDFPDWRTKCAINAKAGNILHIPREGGYLSRVYVDLGEVASDDNHRVRQTRRSRRSSRRPTEILHPYTLDVKEIAWSSVYEVGHRGHGRLRRRPGLRPFAPGLPHRRRLPHAQREGRARHERLDAETASTSAGSSELCSRSARRKACWPRTRPSGSPSRSTSSTSTANGHRSWRVSPRRSPTRRSCRTTTSRRPSSRPGS